MEVGGCRISWHRADVREGVRRVHVSLQPLRACRRGVGVKDGHPHPVQPCSALEWDAEVVDLAARRGYLVLREDELSDVPEYAVDLGAVPKLVHRQERVLEGRRVSHAAEQHPNFTSARVEYGYGEIPNPWAVDGVAAGVGDGVMAGTNVDEILEH
eukprot:1850054-Prymnesium_polylepis.1